MPEDFARLDEHVPATHSQIYSLLVARHGQLIFERYYNGYTQEDWANFRSVTKSFTSALVGIALKHGYLRDLDQPVMEILGTNFARRDDPRWERITIRHLLSMKS